MNSSFAQVSSMCTKTSIKYLFNAIAWAIPTLSQRPFALGSKMVAQMTLYLSKAVAAPWCSLQNQTQLWLYLMDGSDIFEKTLCMKRRRIIDQIDSTVSFFLSLICPVLN